MRPMMILAALALVALASPSYAQKIDKNGRCHDASGKFAKAEVCSGVSGAASSAKGAASGAAAAASGAATGAAKTAEAGASKTAKTAEAAAKPAAAADANGPYKLDAKGKCHDAKGKMAAKSKCAA